MKNKKRMWRRVGVVAAAVVGVAALDTAMLLTSQSDGELLAAILFVSCTAMVAIVAAIAGIAQLAAAAWRR